MAGRAETDTEVMDVETPAISRVDTKPMPHEITLALSSPDEVARLFELIAHRLRLRGEIVVEVSHEEPLTLRGVEAAAQLFDLISRQLRLRSEITLVVR